MEELSETTRWLREVSFFFAAGGALIGLASIIPGYFLVVRPFDRLTKKHKGLLDHLTPIGGGWFRFTKYAVAIAFPNHAKRNARAIAIFSSFEYRRHATNGQVILSYVHVMSWIIAFPFAAIFFGVDKLYGLEGVPLSALERS